MANRVFDAAEPETITIRVKKGDEVAEHPYEVLPLTKPRYDAYMEYAKAAVPIQRRFQEMEASGEMPTDDERRQADELMISAVEQRLRSTNGPATIRDLWNDGLLPVSMLSQIGDYLMREATGNPPA
jgi:hypothetical protein